MLIILFCRGCVGVAWSAIGLSHLCRLYAQKSRQPPGHRQKLHVIYYYPPLEDDSLFTKRFLFKKNAFFPFSASRRSRLQEICAFFLKDTKCSRTREVALLQKKRLNKQIDRPLDGRRCHAPNKSLSTGGGSSLEKKIKIQKEDLCLEGEDFLFSPGETILVLWRKRDLQFRLVIVIGKD